MRTCNSSPDRTLKNWTVQSPNWGDKFRNLVMMVLFTALYTFPHLHTENSSEKRLFLPSKQNIRVWWDPLKNTFEEKQNKYFFDNSLLSSRRNYRSIDVLCAHYLMSCWHTTEKCMYLSCFSKSSALESYILRIHDMLSEVYICKLTFMWCVYFRTWSWPCRRSCQSNASSTSPWYWSRGRRALAANCSSCTNRRCFLR